MSAENKDKRPVTKLIRIIVQKFSKHSILKIFGQ
jgi:hypothetical protein